MSAEISYRKLNSSLVSVFLLKYDWKYVYIAILFECFGCSFKGTSVRKYHDIF